MGRINPLVAIGIPTWGRVTIEWSRAYRHLGAPLGATTVELEPVIGKPIAEARNALMQMAIAQKAEFLFMLGDDVLCPSSIIGSMLTRMRNDPNLHLLTGVYWTKSWPTTPYLWRGMQRGPYLDWKRGEFFEVDYAGCDALMIRLSPEIQALGPDWFSTDWLWEEGQERPSDLATEDFYFYTRARKAGLHLWCDAGIQCLHEDRTGAGLFGLLNEMPQNGGDGVQPPLPLPRVAGEVVRVADLGCGRDSPFFGFPADAQVDRFDGNEAVRPTYRCDLRDLPVPDQSYDLVHSRHVLEHFGRGELLAVLREWTRILRVGGEFRVSVPNLLSAIEWIQRMDAGECAPHPYPWWQLYGEQTDHRDFHYNGFTQRRLRLALEMLDIFDNVSVELGDDGQNLYARATKVRVPALLALAPEWREIAAREGIPVPGLDLSDAPPVATGGTPEAPADEMAIERAVPLPEPPVSSSQDQSRPEPHYPEYLYRHGYQAPTPESPRLVPCFEDRPYGHIHPALFFEERAAGDPPQRASFPTESPDDAPPSGGAIPEAVGSPSAASGLPESHAGEEANCPRCRERSGQRTPVLTTLPYWAGTDEAGNP